MTEQTTNEDLEAEQGAALPDREMMSLISTDPSDQLGGLAGGPDKGPMPMEPVNQNPAPPVEAPSPDVEPTTTGGSDQPRDEVITQSDTASATS